jgi:tetratricopeptide (TPR) repeat protein
VKKLFSPQEVARLAGIPGGRVRYWTHMGLVPHVRQPPKKLKFTFQGLVAVRTIKELREQGVSLHQIRACVEKLKKRHPEIAAPLCEVRFLAFRRKILLARKRRRFTPDGQLHLDFAEAGNRIVRLAEPDTGALFLQALESEGRGDWEKAREKYAAILALKPDHPDALVNLGNILHRWRFTEGAEAHYRQALDADPEHAEANFNLANLLEEKGWLDEAVQLYRKSLDANPEFSEACFNLARTLEKQGKADLARDYWQRCLDLEPAGEWAEYLRERLKED